jgi:Ulp1 family protease
MSIMFLFRAFGTFVIKVDGGDQPGKHRVLKHHTTYHVKQQPPGNSCGFFVCTNMLCFVLQPITNVSVSLFICTLLSSFIFTYVFHILLIHFLIISWQNYDVEFINKKGSSLEHIKERITESLVTQVIDSKREFHF